MKKVLSQIKPSKEEEKKAKRIAEQLMDKLKTKKVKLMLGGSWAKNTWLKGEHDVDVFARFNKEECRNKDISRILENMLKKAGIKYKRVKGSRDYFQAKVKGYDIEIIPIIEIKKADEALNITDISPLHVEWVLKNSPKDEVRIAKRFFKAKKCYGAESYIRGFSGYVIEILTTYYGSFWNLAKGISKWKEKEYIDVRKHGRELSKSKTVSPLVLIDPVDPDRNAAAALSREMYGRIRKVCREYLKDPRRIHFKSKEISKAELKRKAKGKKLLQLEVVPLNDKKDKAGAKMVKAFENIKRELSKEGYRIYESGWEWNKKVLFYFITSKEVPKYRTHTGPKLSQEKNIEFFKEKNRKYKIAKKKGRIYAKIPRKFTKVEEFLGEIIRKDTVRGNIRRISLK